MVFGEKKAYRKKEGKVKSGLFRSFDALSCQIILGSLYKRINRLGEISKISRFLP
jgi:hypothetical protein